MQSDEVMRETHSKSVSRRVLITAVAMGALTSIEGAVIGDVELRIFRTNLIAATDLAGV